MNDAVRAMRRLGEALDQANEREIDQLAAPFGGAAAVSWTIDGRGMIHLEVTLGNGNKVRARGEGKLEALAEAARELMMARPYNGGETNG